MKSQQDILKTFNGSYSDAVFRQTQSFMSLLFEVFPLKLSSLRLLTANMEMIRIITLINYHFRIQVFNRNKVNNEQIKKNAIKFLKTTSLKGGNLKLSFPRCIADITSRQTLLSITTFNLFSPFHRAFEELYQLHECLIRSM